MSSSLAKLFPCLDWARGYDRAALAGDLLAAAIVTVMLIPQSLAYALLAGVPPEMGLYATMLPLALQTDFPGWGQAREAQIDAALSNSFAFGGLNAVLAFSRWRGA